MKKCVNCGKEAQSSNSAICEYCGGALTQTDEFIMPEETRTELYEPHRVIKKSDSSTGKNIALAVLVGAFIGLLCIACFVLGQMSGDEDKDTTTSVEEKETAVEEKEATVEEKETAEKTDSAKPDEKPAPEIEEEIIPQPKEEFPVTAEDDRILTTGDVEAAVKKIRAMYNETQQLKLEIGYIGSSNASYYFYKGELKKIEVPADDRLNYTRIYYFDEEELYFAFVSNAEKENRFYFHNGELIRWIDERKEIYNVTEPCPSDFLDWEASILEESRTVIRMW